MLGIIGIICLGGAGLLYLFANFALRKNNLKLVRPQKKPKCAFLIPARYESAVIEGLLKSIAAQTVPVKMSQVYVIVESLEDPTVEICKKYRCNVVLRKKVKLQRKGYALDEAIKQILKKHHYDLYFVFDADNRLAPTYLVEMLKTYELGYPMATGYRNSKNNNANVIAAVSTLTFTMINTMGNKNRIQHGANIIFSGTGCYVAGELVEKWRGWPFHALTEDYEMSLYAILHHIPTFYNEKAIFYDEQPTKYAQTVDQRTRWIKGYFESRSEFIPQMYKCHKASNQGSIIKECVGVNPIILALVGIVCIVLEGLKNIFVNHDILIVLMVFLGLFLIIYMVLMLVTIVMLKKEKLRFSKAMKWKVVFFNPLYLLTYIPCALKAIFSRNVEWKRIEHGKSMKS